MKSKIMRFLLSLLIAFGIWLYVVTVVSPESEVVIHNIPVQFDGDAVLAERDLIVVSDKNCTVNLKLFGNRVDLNKLSASNVTVLADLSQITEPGEHHVRFDVTYPAAVQQGNIDVMERDPQYITVTVAERSWKNIPVEIRYTGSVPEGYVVDGQNAKLDQTSITVTGPADVLARIAKACITVDLDGRMSTIVDTYRLSLCGVDGNPVTDATKVTTSTNEVRATIKINKIKQVALEVELIDGGGLRASDVTVNQNLQYIMVSGSNSALENLDKIVVARISLAEMIKSETLTFDIQMPDGISNVTGETKLTVEIILPELEKLETRTFVITTIRTVNAPADRIVEVITEKLVVEIRGTAEALDALDESQLVAIVDCKDVSGMMNMNATLNATVVLPEDSSAGVVGDAPQVVVKITVISSGGGK